MKNIIIIAICLLFFNLNAQELDSLKSFNKSKNELYLKKISQGYLVGYELGMSKLSNTAMLGHYLAYELTDGKKRCDIITMDNYLFYNEFEQFGFNTTVLYSFPSVWAIGLSNDFYYIDKEIKYKLGLGMCFDWGAFCLGGYYYPRITNYDFTSDIGLRLVLRPMFLGYLLHS